jgi:hypothetical protein
MTPILRLKYEPIEGIRGGVEQCNLRLQANETGYISHEKTWGTILSGGRSATSAATLGKTLLLSLFVDSPAFRQQL